MPHYQFPRIRCLMAVAICLLIASSTVFGTIVSAQPGVSQPPQGLETWSEPASLSNSGDQDDSTKPDVAVCDNGTVYVVWEQGGKIWYRVKRPNLGWDNASPVSFKETGLPATGSEPAIAVSSDCVLHVVWSDLWFDNYEIFYTYNSGSGFVALPRVSKSEGQSGQPDITVDSSGEPHIVWVETRSQGGPLLYEAERAPAEFPGEWNRDWISGGGGQQVQAPALAIDHGDQLHLTWMRYDRSRYDILYKRPEDWSRDIVENISNSFNYSWLPDIAISGNRVVLTWQETVDGDDEIYVTWRRPDSFASFGSTINLSNSDVNSRAPALTADGFGDFFTAWDEANPTDAVLSRHWRGFGNWADVDGVSNGGIEIRDPAVAASPTGSRVYAVWAQKDGPNDNTDDIYLSEMELELHRFYLPLMAKGYEP